MQISKSYHLYYTHTFRHLMTHHLSEQIKVFCGHRTNMTNSNEWTHTHRAFFWQPPFVIIRKKKKNLGFGPLVVAYIQSSLHILNTNKQTECRTSEDLLLIGWGISDILWLAMGAPQTWKGGKDQLVPYWLPEVDVKCKCFLPADPREGRIWRSHSLTEF